MISSSLSLYPLLTIFLVIPLILMNNTFAISPSLLAQQATTTAPLSQQSTGIKITSPTTGQQVPVVGRGGGLNISGTSTDDVHTDCQVSVIINDVKPYQPANATGSGGKDDYSTWDFLLTSSSKYPALIKAGPNNKITAKLVCNPPHSLTKWYSVNVTGIALLSSSSNTSAIPHSRLATDSENIATSNNNNNNNTLFNATMLNITSPTSGQQIPDGSKITISGTSMDDFYTNCSVYIKKNNLPFQKVNPAGFTGPSDYSIWKFTFTDKKNGAITPGNTNNLTAKISCINNNNDDTKAAAITSNSTASMDNNNNNSNNITSYANINIIGTNQPPLAVAKTDSTKQVKEGDKVILNGKGSSDPNGDSLTYLWKQIFSDHDLHRVNIHIVNPNKALATFKVPNELAEDTTFTFALTVRDSYGQTNTNIVSIKAISNSNPIADAGGDIKAIRGEEVVLDGTHSHDPDRNGKIISYIWRQSGNNNKGGLGGSGSHLEDANQPVARFFVPYVKEDTTFEFTLTVTDNEGAKSEDKVKVNVKGNSKPVANADSDKKITEIGEQVTLEGTSSHDPDPTGQINSYKWKQTSGSPSVELNSADTAISSFIAPRVQKDTTFEFTLTVTDNEGAKSQDTVKVKVKAPPLPPTTITTEPLAS